MGDYWEIMTGGQFRADGSLPNVFTLFTDGWWNTAEGTSASGIGVIFPYAYLRSR